MVDNLIIGIVSLKCPMIAQPPTQSIFATLWLAGRRIGERTREQSKELTGELRHSCNAAAQSISSLRQYDRKELVRKIPRAFGHLLHETYVKRPLALLHTGIGKRTAWFMITGMLPLLLALSVILLPSVIFDSPQSQAYYFFARTLAGDPISLLPVLIGLVAISSVLYFPAAKPKTEEVG